MVTEQISDEKRVNEKSKYLDWDWMMWGKKQKKLEVMADRPTVQMNLDVFSHTRTEKQQQKKRTFHTHRSEANYFSSSM